MVEPGKPAVLDEALKRLAAGRPNFRRTDPIAVLVIAILVFLGMTIFLIPTFAGIFEDWAPSCRPCADAVMRWRSRSETAGILLAIWMLNRFTHNGRRTIDRLA